MTREPPTTGPRLVAATGILFGIAMLGSLALTRSHMLAANFEVYQLAAEAALSGESVYDVAPDRFPEFFYLYPPITIVQFLPFALVSLPVGFAIHTVTELLVGTALALVIVRWIEHYRSLPILDRVLIVGFVLGSIHTVPSLFYGQVNLRMALLIALGLYLFECRPGIGVENIGSENQHSTGRTGARRELDRQLDERQSDGQQPTERQSDRRQPIGRHSDRRQPTGRLTNSRTLDDRVLSGVALAGAALYKVFPAALGFWLLRCRGWRSITAAVATGVGGLVAGVLVFGRESTRTYFFEALLPRGESGEFAGGLDPMASYVTIRRPLSVLVPSIDPTLLSVLAAVVLAPPLLYLYTDLETPLDRLVALHATVLVVFVYFPSYPLYYVVVFGTLLPTLYLVTEPRSRQLLVVGAVLANVVITGTTLESIVAVVPDPLGSTVHSLAVPVLTVATPVLLGCLCMLAGCVVHRFRRAGLPSQ